MTSSDAGESFEDGVLSRLTNRPDEPPDTDLDYYAKPENYAGSNLQVIQRLIYAQQNLLTQSQPQLESRKSSVVAANMTRRASSAGRASPVPAPIPAPVSRCSSSDPFIDDREQSRRRRRKSSTMGLDEILRQQLLQQVTPSVRSRKTSEEQSWSAALTSGGADSAFVAPASAPVQPSRRRLSRFLSSDGIGESRKPSVFPATDGTIALPPRSKSARRSRGDLNTLSGKDRAESQRRASLYPKVFRPSRSSLAHHFHPNRAGIPRQSKAKERFRHAVRLLMLILRGTTVSTKTEEGSSNNSGRTFTEMALTIFSSDGMTFDVSQFKAKKEINISSDVRNILSSPAESRTAEQIQTAVYGLQHLKAFAEYPLHMQEKLCKVATYQPVFGRRVIIRQGHIAENFYFVLSGQVLVRIFERNPKTGEGNLRTASIMKKGSSFGELALLHHSRRTATVVSQGDVQLAAIGRENFFDIFMGGQAQGELPPHVKYIRRGAVIVKDSNESDFIYVIKSGTCSVIKELQGVVPNFGIARQRILLDDLQWPRLSSAGTGHSGLSSKSDFGLIKTIHEAHSEVDSSKINHEKKVTVDDRDHSGDSTEKSPENKDLKSTEVATKRFDSLVTSKKAHFMTTRPAGNDLHRSAGDVTSVKQRDSMSDIKMTSYERTLRGDMRQLQVESPVFVQVQLLKPKDVFGLTNMRFGEESLPTLTSFSLISNGAECVMLSKKFFAQHSNVLVKKMVRYQLQPYPGRETLQENLQTKVDWDLYKRRLLRQYIRSES